MMLTYKGHDENGISFSDFDTSVMLEDKGQCEGEVGIPPASTDAKHAFGMVWVEPILFECGGTVTSTDIRRKHGPMPHI